MGAIVLGNVLPLIGDTNGLSRGAAAGEPFHAELARAEDGQRTVGGHRDLVAKRIERLGVGVQSGGARTEGPPHVDSGIDPRERIGLSGGEDPSG